MGEGENGKEEKVMIEGEDGRCEERREKEENDKKGRWEMEEKREETDKKRVTKGEDGRWEKKK